MRIPGKKFLRQSAYWARSRFGTGALILGYHRVGETVDDVYSIAVHPQFFAEQLAILRRFARPIPLDALVQGLQVGRLPPRSVAITFDDGYADFLLQAKPLLEQYEVPATLFVATGYLGRRFWWDDLAVMLLAADKLPEQLSFDQDGKPTVWSLAELGGRRKALLEQIYQSLIHLGADERQQAMAQLTHQTGVNVDEVAPDNRALTAEELTEMASDELVTIGAHTVNHPVLTSLSEGSQRREIEQSKQFLETLLDEPISAFSYPNGSGDEMTRQLVRAAGFTLACNSFNGVARPGSELFNLPRFWVPDQSGKDFSRWLRRWLVN